MHFPELININNRDKVLEVGPGSTPFFRSDVLLDKKYATQNEFHAQCGADRDLATHKTTVYYEGNNFPFADKEFDYVVCSHVLEHVDDVELFVSELMRVGRRGYIEFPTVFYEYLYNFDVHKNILLYKDGRILWMKKTETPLNFFKPINKLFMKTLEGGQDQMIVPQKELFFQGFEWSERIITEKAADLSEVCPNITQSASIVKMKKDFLFIYKVYKKFVAICKILNRKFWHSRFQQ